MAIQRDPASVAHDRAHSIHVSVMKGETCEADPATWPKPVHRAITEALDMLCARHPDLNVAHQTYHYDAGRRVCWIEFYFVEPAR